MGGETFGARLAQGDGVPLVIERLPDNQCGRHFSQSKALLSLIAEQRFVPSVLRVETTQDALYYAQMQRSGEVFDIHPREAVQDVLTFLLANRAVSREDGDWGGFVKAVLSGGGPWDWKPLRESERAGFILDALSHLSARADDVVWRGYGVVHMDFHTDNILLHERRLSAVLDWDDVRLGDPGFDLMSYAFDLDGHCQDIWDRVVPLVGEPYTAFYAAMLCLKCTSSALVSRQGDVPRQLDRAERVLTRFDVLS